jgi:hypothetical protein
MNARQQDGEYTQFVQAEERGKKSRIGAKAGIFQ